MSGTGLAAALADRYRIERELGQGGMATVYLAEDLRHHRKVAVKVLRPELAAVLGAERFLREIETTANLRHPHILPLYDSGAAGGDLFYVMPLVEGESLRDRLNREKQLPVDDALRIAREVAEARRALDLDPDGLATLSVLSSVFARAGQREQAQALAQRVVAATDNPRRLGAVVAQLPEQEGLAIIRRLEALPPGTWGRESGLANAYLSVGDTARALSAMERAAAGDGDLLPGFLPLQSHQLVQLRDNARFAAVMRRYNLDPLLMSSLGGPAPR
jgi:tetratricopeptide (TPR) repeat protein